MDRDGCRELFSTQRVARLATLGPDGPHIVPMVFAVSEDNIVSVVDHKPKRTTQLQRLANIASNPSVTVLADHYDDDWERLWWVRADGVASVIESGDDHISAVDLLVAKYEQYQLQRPLGPAIVVSVTRWSGWMASAPGWTR